MKITLQKPFSDIWREGYLIINPQQRRNIVLYNNGSDRKTISYARYLMGVKLGYEVPPEYEVDHIDDDKTNDDINNLQLLTKEQNKIKQEWHYVEHVQNCYGVECNWCGTHFLLTERQVKMKLAAGIDRVFCSKSCYGNYRSYYSDGYDQREGIIPSNKTPSDVIAKIKELANNNLSSYKIAEILNVPRSTVARYMKK